ncbi:MAG TPA: hypothetical protein ENK19_08050, partial [Acidobacteria bacterium]|nr:hypothetical protein [Acidobacteriota bacterium]
MADLARRLKHDLGYYPFRAFLAVGSRLPLSLLRPMGVLAGRTALTLAARDRARAQEHLAIAFPELDEDRQREILRASARHLGLMLAEVTWLWRASPAQVASLCDAEGFEHLDRAREAGRGAVLFTAHCGNWEMLNARLGVGDIPMTIAVREVYDPRVNVLATTLRARFGTEVVFRGKDAGRQLNAALARNRVLGLLIDQDIRKIPGVFVPFFGRPAWTPSGAAMLAVRHKIPVIPAFVHRLPDGRHLARAHPPLPVPEGGSLRERIEA